MMRGPQGSTSGAARVDDRTTTKVKELTEDEKQKVHINIDIDICIHIYIYIRRSHYYER